MSSTSRYGKTDILNKKVPENPKYKNVKRTVDTGASVTRYMERIEEMRKNYKFKKDEIFKRMKVTTFAQLVLQVANVVNIEQERMSLQSGGGESVLSESTITHEREERESISDENVPPLHLGDDGDEERPDTSATDTCRSTLHSVIHGVGEFDLKDQGPQKISLPSLPSASVPEVVSLPYLLLDVRDRDAFQQCHIIGAMHYPVSMLSRSYNYFTQEILIFKNKLGKIIILYDEDERLASSAATTFVQREVDNVFMLSGGLKVLAKKFPEGLITGTLPASCQPTPPTTRRSAGKSGRAAPVSSPPSSAEKAGAPQLEEWFNPEHLEKIESRLNDELISQDSSSRLSSRVSSRSTTSAASRASSAASTASKKPSWK